MDIDTAETLYRIDWVIYNKGKRGILFPGPLTHKQAMKAIRMTTVYSWRRLLLVPV